MIRLIGWSIIWPMMEIILSVSQIGYPSATVFFSSFIYIPLGMISIAILSFLMRYESRFRKVGIIIGYLVVSLPTLLVSPLNPPTVSLFFETLLGGTLLLTIGPLLGYLVTGLVKRPSI